MKSEERTMINGDKIMAVDDVSSGYSTQITQVKEDEKIIITRPANHNEIALMESDWKRIRNKVNKIKIRSGINFVELIMGALISYIINIIIGLIRGLEVSYLPIIICVVLLVLVRWLASKIPFLKANNDEINKVHLEELNEFLNQVDSSI